MFGTYEATPRRSDWDKYYGDPERYQYGVHGRQEVLHGGGYGGEMGKHNKMYGDDYHKHQKKLAKMDKKERKKYLKKHGLFYPEAYEQVYYKPHYETHLSKEERVHPHYKMHHEDYPHEKMYGKMGKEKYGGHHEMYGGMGKEKYGGMGHEMYGGGMGHEMYGGGHKMYKKHGMGYGMEGVHFKRDKEGRKKWKAVCDMGESEKYWIVRAELPGVRKEQLRVEMEGKDLVIIGKKKKELWHMDKLGISHKGKEMDKKDMGKTSSEGGLMSGGTSSSTSTSTSSGSTSSMMKDKSKDSLKGIKWWRKERGLKGNFKRRIHLPKKVDQSAIEALYKDGILEVLIKKPEGFDKKPIEGHTIPIH